MESPWIQILIAALTSSAFTSAVLIGLAFLGRSLIERWLSRGLEKYKAELQATLEEYKAELQATNDRELEHYRYQVNALFNRVTKIHEKEIEVLPTVWQKLQDAYAHVFRFTKLLQRYPVFDSMTEPQLTEFLKESKLSDYHKQKLLEAPNKDQYYSQTIFKYELQEVSECIADFHNYILYNRIFLSPDLSAEFKAVDALLHHVVSIKALAEESRDPQLAINAFQEVQDKAGPMIEKIERLVQKRLHLPEAE
ncbi:MAG: hypothetical protein E3J21_06170 [Anaerolineales bacterium]|nr:MAG: hypothetical protein E3J21_06170 [Anaerolineales bacterium]